jgi:hypothetical protein
LDITSLIERPVADAGRARAALAYEQLHRLAKEYYGLRLRLRVFPPQPDPTDRVTIGLLVKNRPLRLMDRALFPILIGPEVVAALEIVGIDRCASETFDRLRQTIDLVVATRVSSESELEAMQAVEARLLREEAAETGNVFFLSDYRVRSVAVEPPGPSRVGRIAFNIPCLIRSASPEDIHRMAVEIHHLSQRYAFLFLSDLDPERLTPRSLLDLGPLNIFVPELRAIDKGVERVLEHYLLLHRQKTSPQIIAGTTLSRQSPLSAQALSPNLLRLLSVVELDLKEPFEHYKSAGIVNFFYDSLVKIT